MSIRRIDIAIMFSVTVAVIGAQLQIREILSTMKRHKEQIDKLGNAWMDLTDHAGFYHQLKVTNDSSPEIVSTFEYPTNYVVTSNMVYYPNAHAEELYVKAAPFPLTDMIIRNELGMSNWFRISYSSRLVRKWLDANIGDRGFIRDNGSPMEVELCVHPCWSAEEVKAWIESAPWR